MSEMHVDWTVLDVSHVEPVIFQAARSISKNVRYQNAVEIEDLQQEARILVATKPDLQECVDEGLMGLLHSRLVRDLADLYKTEARRKDKAVSYELLLDTRGAA
ncbi:hypothetical protein OG474_30365 [Kribbella sp. NBC_01505]|uniref:hypothetical protein n=1 Tax=Kribbella sp. NBC_01505 TaxID=2903580 RepID=UPI0038655E6C